jgi:hypothetical protein
VTLVLLWILRILIILLILRMVLRMFAVGSDKGSGRPRRVRERLGGALVRDPHCGTYVPQTRALAVRSGASTLHFCSAACRDAYTARR